MKMLRSARFPTPSPQRLLLGLTSLMLLSCSEVFVEKAHDAIDKLPPLSQSNVLDQTHKLSIEERAKLDTQIQDLQKHDIFPAVLLVSSLKGISVEEYATRVFEHWQLGEAGNDNGLLILIAPDDRKLRLEVGYGLEGHFPDITAARIVDHQLIPYIKQANYYQGIKSALDELLRIRTQGGSTPRHHSEISMEEFEAQKTAEFKGPFLAFVKWVMLCSIICWSSVFLLNFSRRKNRKIQSAKEGVKMFVIVQGFNLFLSAFLGTFWALFHRESDGAFQEVALVFLFVFSVVPFIIFAPAMASGRIVRRGKAKTRFLKYAHKKLGAGNSGIIFGRKYSVPTPSSRRSSSSFSSSSSSSSSSFRSSSGGGRSGGGGASGSW